MMQTVFHQQILTDASAQDTTSTVLGPSQLTKIQELTIYTVFGPGTSAGVVKIEGAHREDWTGTWAVLATITWAVASSVQLTAIAGVHLAVRVRVSTAITGGTVSAVAVGN